MNAAVRDRPALALAFLLGCAAPRVPTSAPTAAARTAAVAPGTVEVAVTVDDLPVHGPAFAGIDRLAIAERLMAAFAAHRLPAVYGFVNGKTVDDDATTEGILRRWLAGGNALGTHSWSHASLNGTALDDYLADVQKGESIVTRLAPPGSWKVFRYPFLQEG